LNERRLLVLVLLLFTPIFTVNGQDYSPNSLTIDVFQDGSTVIDYRIKPDPTLVTVNVTLPGENYANLIAVDQDGVILDWEQISDGIDVDGLGANELIITYSTSFLTNKTGSTWTVSADSPVSTLYQLPLDAVLVGLSSPPSSISIVDNRAIITMPPGFNRITYILGTTGTKEHALVLLIQAGSKIEEAEDKEIHVLSVDSLFTDAGQAYDAGSYTQTEQLSQQIISQVSELLDEAGQAQAQIVSVEELLEDSTGLHGSETLVSAQGKLDEAKQEYESGDYSAAYSLAVEAVQLLQETEQETGQKTGLNPMYYGFWALLVIGLGGFIFIQKRSKTGKTPELDELTPSVDLDKVFKYKDHLRTDEKAVLRYIEESNGAFITEIRERFDIPKSTAWRMIKRLEEYGVVAVSRVGRETYLNLRSPEGLR
jgi:uncharacterized membrane protein